MKTALVVAHPDDEIVWFSSILDKIDIIYICYLDALQHKTYKAKRLLVLNEHPLKEKIIALDANNETVEAELRKALKGYSTVYTHNPWGEYGHEQHILVHNIVKKLQKKYRFTMWVSDYSPEKLILSADREKRAKIKKLYKHYRVWTASIFMDAWLNDDVFCRMP